MPKQYISALALDLGRRRIGIAGCDRLGMLVTELPTLQNRSFRLLVDELRAIIAERQVNTLVVGLPYTLNGELGKQAQWVKTFAEKLSAILQIPVEYVDERLTSFQAAEMLQAEGVTLTQHNKGLVDQKAAAIILQQWLDQRARQSASPKAPPFAEPVTGDSE